MDDMGGPDGGLDDMEGMQAEQVQMEDGGPMDDQPP